MITRGIIEQVIDAYHVRVRIPFFNKVASAPTATKTQDLAVATISTLPNSKMNYKVGDIVFIGFEDHMSNKPVILGQLSRADGTDQYPELTCGTLNTKYDTHLSKTTYIGEVQPEEIAYLTGARSNIQFQIDLLSGGSSDLPGRLTAIEESIKALQESVAKLNRIYHGEVVPTSSLGADGDIYILYEDF